MGKVIAVTNQKGGVGKTTTALNLGVGLARRGYRVLFIDMDPQCSLTYIMGGNSAGKTVQDLLLGQVYAAASIQHCPEGDLIASSPNLSALEMMLNQTGKEYRLREAIEPIREFYDFIMIDSPPTLGVLTVNILTAADGVVVPALADIFSLQGVGQLYSSIQAVKTYCNPNLTIYGILLIRHGQRFILNRQMKEMLEETAAQIGTRVFEATIRESVAVREAQADRKSIFAYSKSCKQAQDYANLTDEFLRQNG